MAHIKFRAGLIAVVFLAVLAFPSANAYFALWPDLASAENRALATMPQFALDSLDSLPKRYDHYYTDHFPMRFRAINWYGQVQYRLFDTSPIPNEVIIGRDGWFFLAGNEQNSYTGRYRFWDGELEKLRKELEYRNDYIKGLGGKFYFMVVPSKNNVYADKMKGNVVREHDASWGEHVYDYLRRNTKIKLIDAVPAVRATHDREMTYFKLDNHWNQLGAFYAANAALSVIQEDFPTVHPNRLSDYSVHQSPMRNGNLVDMFGLDLVLVDTLVEVRPLLGNQPKVMPNVPYPGIPQFGFAYEYETRLAIEGSRQPKLLLITDSFGRLFFPFIATQFRESVRIFDAWQYALNAPIVQNEQPDVVLLMVLESNLRNILQHLSHEKPEEPSLPSSTLEADSLHEFQDGANLARPCGVAPTSTFPKSQSPVLSTRSPLGSTLCT